jgi:hypothetical protein
VEPKDQTSKDVWTAVVATSAAAATVVGGIYGSTHVSTFKWNAGPMIACYVLALISVVGVLAVARKWSFPGVRRDGPGPGLHISEEHGEELRAEAREWSKGFSDFVNPNWAVHLAALEELDSDEGLSMLRRHFPKVNSEYSEWRVSNNAMRGVPTRFWEEVASGIRKKPATEEGEAALKKHNELAQTLAATLGVIAAQTDIDGQCDQCRDNRGKGFATWLRAIRHAAKWRPRVSKRRSRASAP